MSENPNFSSEGIEELNSRYGLIDQEKENLLLKYCEFNYTFDKAREYALHGLLRRVCTLNRCIHNIFSSCPPEQVKRIDDEKAMNLTINLQSFILNIFGCLDNIAWIWNYECNLNFLKNKIGLTPQYKELRETFSSNFQDYLNRKTFDDWIQKYLKDYRDTLAHRIPLYIIPFTLTQEEAKHYQELEKQKWKSTDPASLSIIDEQQSLLGRFMPLMRHSFSESPEGEIFFHPQVLADWSTIIELADKFFIELQNKKLSPTITN